MFPLSELRAVTLVSAIWGFAQIQSLRAEVNDTFFIKLNSDEITAQTALALQKFQYKDSFIKAAIKSEYFLRSLVRPSSLNRGLEYLHLQPEHGLCSELLLSHATRLPLLPRAEHRCGAPTAESVAPA